MPLPKEKNYYTAEDYYAMPEDIRVELVNGEIIYMASPTRLHQELSRELLLEIGNYIRSNKGKCRVYPAPFDVQLKDGVDTVLVPDISVICDMDKLTKHGCIGAPDWVIEIVSPSNPNHDYITKLNLYSDAGVREYWIVEPRTRVVYVYDFQGGELPLRTYTFNDTIKAGIYDDLYIDFAGFDLGE